VWGARPPGAPPPPPRSPENPPPSPHVAAAQASPPHPKQHAMIRMLIENVKYYLRPRHPPAAWRQPSPVRGARAATTVASGGGGGATGCATRCTRGSGQRATPHGCARAPPPRQESATPARSFPPRQLPSQTAAAGRGHCRWRRSRSAVLYPHASPPSPRSPTGGSRVTYTRPRLRACAPGSATSSGCAPAG